nr:adenosine deaminase [Nakamurella flavida]
MIDLHTHLEGRVRPATAVALAADLGLPDRDWAAALTLPRPGTLTTFLDRVGASYPFFSSPDAITRIAREAVEDAAADGVDHLEVRFGPGTHVRAFGLDMDDVIAAVCRGFADGTAATGLPAGVVIAALRSHPDDLNAEVVAAATRFAGRGVVGFDLAGDELRFPDLERYVSLFRAAGAAGLGLTCHAAEAAPGVMARRAVELLGVTRIGHGTHIVDDPDVLAWCADHGVVVEMCPTSNWFTGALAAVADHPAPRFRDAGVPVVLGDDNPVQTGSSMAAERRVLHEELGFSPADLAELDRVSVAAAFLEPGQRSALAARLPR